MVNNSRLFMLQGDAIRDYDEHQPWPFRKEVLPVSLNGLSKNRDGVSHRII